MKKLTSLFLYLGILAVIFKNILVYTVGAITPGYSPTSDFISELSSEGTSYETLMNLGSLVFLGIALIITAFALYKRLRDPGLSLSMAYMAIAGVGFIGIGLFPCPPGCRPEIDTSQMTIHTLSGFIATIALSLSAIVYGLSYLRGNKSSVRAASLALGSVGLIAFIGLWVTIVGAEFGIDFGLYQVKGLLQRLNVAAGDLWVLLACISCLSLSETPVRATALQGTS